MHASVAPNANRLSPTIAGAVRLVASHNRSAFEAYFYAGFYSSGSALHGKST
jgi:hypothetical protein